MTTPVPQPSAVVEKDSGAEADSPWESMREKAEQARDEAERRRAHAEDLYQSHLISAEAYRKAEAEYQREMLKYQNRLAEYHRALNPTGAKTLTSISSVSMVSGKPRSARTSRHATIASRMLERASSRVSPWLTQPGIEVHASRMYVLA